MIIRQSANAGLHFVGGAVMGLTLVLAACTVARTAQVLARGRGPSAPARGPDTRPSPPPDTLPGASGDIVD